MLCGVVYTWVFNTWFLGPPEIVDFGGLGDPGGPKNIPKGGGRSPGMVFGVAGAAQTFKDHRFPAGLKTMY